MKFRMTGGNGLFDKTSENEQELIKEASAFKGYNFTLWFWFEGHWDIRNRFAM